MMLVRDATAADLAAILPIHNQAVRETTAIWRTVESDMADRETWLTGRAAAGFPVLVAEINGAVAGYGSYGDFRTGQGYHLTVEHSVYVAQGAQGRGVGRALLAALIERAQGQGRHAMIAGIEAGNAASIGLHISLGFVEVGRLPQVGAKFGRWLDLVLLQLTLDARAAP